MTVSATVTSKVTAIKKLATQLGIDSTNNDLLIDGLDTSVALNGSSTPAITDAAYCRITLASGAATLDLRTIPGLEAGVIDGNGKKVKVIKYSCPGTNANPITASTGASNGIALLGTGWSIPVQPGAKVLCELQDTSVTIDGTHKTIDFAGTGAQVIDIEILLG